MRRTISLLMPWIVGLLLWFPMSLFGAGENGRCSLWIDVYRGESLAYEDVLNDLETVRVIYLGEYHTVKRHHEIQERILADLLSCYQRAAT
jgi:uncharacterized iron-regulated protein